MTDIALVPVGDGDELDAVLLAGDFVADNSIHTAVYVSLLSDAEDLDSPDGDPRGWWADAFSTIPGDSTGSLLWLLSRSKQNDDTLNDANRYAKAALQWMLDDDVASAISVSASWMAIGAMALDIGITGPTGKQAIRLAYLWQQSLIAPTGNIAPGAVQVSLSPSTSTWNAQISWTPTRGAVQYLVYLVTTPGGEQVVPSATVTGTTTTVGGLTASTIYYLRVAAIDANGNMIAISAEITVPTGVLPPLAPTGLTAQACDGEIELSWTASAGATSYNVYIGTSSGGEATSPTVSGVTGTSTAVTGLANGVEYFSIVKALRSGESSTASNEASATPAALTAPTGLVPSGSTETSITLSWTASPGASSYNLYQGTSPGGEGGTPVQTGISGTTTTSTGLTYGDTYYFEVSAVNACGQEQKSTEISAKAGEVVTWNPADATSDVTLSNGDLTYERTGSADGTYAGGCRATRGVSTGKWYWEVDVGYCAAVAYFEASAIATAAASLLAAFGQQSTGWAYFTLTDESWGSTHNNVTNSSFRANYQNGGRIMCALDMDNGMVWWGFNGGWVGWYRKATPRTG